VLVNRGLARGRYAAQLLRMPFVPLAEFSPRGFPVVVHATPLSAKPVFDVDDLPDGAAVLDMVYAPEDTALAAAARARGLTVVDGWDMLLADASCQFRLMTGRQMPIPRARALLAAARDARRRPAQPAPCQTTKE
jgi:3-dehydroquinate dehydratase / shikimate dehydrogenase